MTQQTSATLTLPFNDFLRNWWYMPLTIWKKTFESFYHPQLFLGCNIQDMDDEYYVLNQVGSYGKQISQILKVLDIVVAHPPSNLTAEEQQTLAEFRGYTERVATALAERRGPQAHELTTGYVKRLEEALETQRKTHSEEFERVWTAMKLMVEEQNERTRRAKDTNSQEARDDEEIDAEHTPLIGVLE
jgi:hypothetical protein